MTPRTRALLPALALLALLAAIPFVLDGRYVITQMTLFFIWATVATQWNLVLGYGGIFSLAQMALFACGAYVTAMLGYYFDLTLWLAMPIGGVATMLLSMLIGLACLRLKGPYVALLTLAVAQVLYILIINDTECFRMTDSGCMPLMGGVRGISRFGDLGFRELFGRNWIVASYLCGLLLLLVATVFTVIITRGPMGLAFRALRDNPGYALSRGISKFKYQLWLFAMSAFFTGLAGAFYAAHFRVVGPAVFSITLLLFLLSMVVVGGIGTLWGPILGTAILMLADEGLKEVSDYRALGLGLVLPLFIVLLPAGAAGTLAKLKIRPARAAVPPDA